MTQNRDKNLIQVITLYHHPTIHPPTSLTSTSDWWSVGFAVEWWMMYLGSSVDLLASYSFSAIRSSCTKCVELDEVGKVLALLYSVESIIPIFMTQVRRDSVSQFIKHYSPCRSTPPCGRRPLQFQELAKLSGSALSSSSQPVSQSSHSFSLWWPGGNSREETSMIWGRRHLHLLKRQLIQIFDFHVYFFLHSNYLV